MVAQADQLSVADPHRRTPLANRQPAFLRGSERRLFRENLGAGDENGGTLQLSYDDGDAGFYVGGGGYSYLGQNVASNTSINANAGVYLRPYHDEYRQLQAGLSMSYMDYSKNLSYFTYGQGATLVRKTTSAYRCRSV